jgi:hypothetical protein
MIDIGPRLHSRLRAKFDRLEAENPPERLTSFQPAASRRRHRSLNVFVGVAAIAVVAAGAAAFAVELAGHPHPTTTTPSPAQGGSLPKMPVYSPTPPPPYIESPTPMPVYGTGFSTSWNVVIPLTKNTGSAALPVFVPEGYEYVQYACVGTGYLQIVSTDGTVNERFKQCSSSTKPVDAGLSEGYGPFAEGRPLTLKVVTSPSVRWELVIAETAPPLILPALPALPADAKVLVPLTYGRGIASTPSFAHHDFITMDWWCSGPGGMQVFVSNGNESTSASVCGFGGGGGTDDYLGKRETLVVDVGPMVTWELLVYWEPSDQTG